MKLDRQAKKILVSTLVSNTAYALIAPFLPLEFANKGISNSMIGYIFAVYSVAIIICSPFIGRLMLRFGSDNLISFGLFTMGVSFALLGLIDSMTDQTTILLYSISLRLL
jgi:DHA1 family multidrug resistance protein-like MFS transporter